MDLDDRFRPHKFHFDPSFASVLFPTGGVLAVLFVLPASDWSRTSLTVLFSVAGCLALMAIVRLGIGTRLPTWSLHVDVAVAGILTSFLALIGPNGHVSFALLYIWQALYVTLYFRPFATALHIGASGVGYALVLTWGANVDEPVIAWLMIFGTAVVWSAVLTNIMNLLRRASSEDGLTHLPNRRAWDSRLDEEIERARRHGTSLSLAVIDIDSFKDVNDLAGHQAGDLLLCEFADGWRNAVRGGGDFVARLGGDEFGVIAPGSDDRGINQLQRRLVGSSPSGASASVGMATWDGSESAGELVRRADEAMYQVKRMNGRRRSR